MRTARGREATESAYKHLGKINWAVPIIILINHKILPY